jgi:hypothetical protein
MTCQIWLEMNEAATGDYQKMYSTLTVAALALKWHNIV